MKKITLIALLLLCASFFFESTTHIEAAAAPIVISDHSACEILHGIMDDCTNDGVVIGATQVGAFTRPTASKKAQFTAYNAEVNQTDNDPYTMASGKRVYDGAVANNCLKFGQKIELAGKIYTVEDRMASRYDCDHYDLFFWSYADAKKFGRQVLEYKVLNQ